jgi:hypothetical protein
MLFGPGGQGECQVLPQDTQTSQSAAERMRHYRQRQRRGERIIRVQIGPAEIEALVSKGFIGPDDRQDPVAIEYGLSVLIDQALGDS